MKYAYYPGCSAESTARDQYMSVQEVSRALDIELVEPKGWSCCGSTPAHHTDRMLSIALPVANLLIARQMGLDMVVFCAACYNRMKVANHEIRTNPAVRKEISDVLEEEYDGSVKVHHFIEVLSRDIGAKKLQESFTHSLNGLKVASYYGCLLVRPPEVTNFDDPENPMIMDNLITIMGGESVDWSNKVECCGGGLSLTRTDIVVELSHSILSTASAAGAQCMAVACPMCQVNLDLRQSDINKTKKSNFEIPVVYITQLVGLCLGIPADRLGMEKCVVSPRSIIEMVNQ